MMFFVDKNGNEDLMKTLIHLSIENEKLKEKIKEAITRKEIENIQNKIALNNIRAEGLGER
jgi:hypothetical protein